MATNVHTDQNTQLAKVVKVDANTPVADPHVATQIWIDPSGYLVVSAG
jgi:hypothetical protein